VRLFRKGKELSEDKIKQRFKQVADQIDAEADQLEQDVRNKNAAIRDETVKKVAGSLGSQ
jgi:gas vesicle protein